MIATSNQLRVIYSSKRAVKSAKDLGFEICRIAMSLKECWRLRITSGSKVKKLCTKSGDDFRLRLDNIRVVFSIIDTTAYIHSVETRADVYKNDAFDIVLKNFSEAIKTADSCTSPLHERLEEIGYEALHFDQGTSAYQVSDPKLHISIGYHLRPNQQLFFNTVLPIDHKLSKRSPRLIIGNGPPGAGKTIIGSDIAIESLMDDNNVDILVPSRNLQNEYMRLLDSVKQHISEVHKDSPGIRVMRFEDYFQQRAGRECNLYRESEIIAWTRSRLLEPRLNAKLGTINGKIDAKKAMERLPILVDTLLEDEDWWRTFDDWGLRIKDPIVEPILPYIRLLGEIRPGLLDALERYDESGLLTRAALADLPPSDISHHARLVIVDEAQDLAPAEWRSLLRDAYIRLQHFDQRILLLGDLRQRVNLVPFAWEDIKSFAQSECKLGLDQMDDLEVDTTSYRMRREVASAAESVFDKNVQPLRKFRTGSRLDLEKLPSGGKVVVAVYDGRRDILMDALSAMPLSAIAGEYLFIVHGRSVNFSSMDRTDVVNYSIKEAKGLEADRVVVNFPFGKEHRSLLSGRIDYEDATEYYTAMSRARDHVLLLVDRASWNLLSQSNLAWEGAEVVEGERLTKRWLSEALLETRVGLPPEQIIEARLRQLEAAANAHSSLPGETTATVLEALKDLARFANDDMVIRLVEIGAVLAASHTEAFQLLRSLHIDRRSNLPIFEDVAFQLFFGELALATACSSANEAVVGPRWDSEWLGCVRDESRLQSLRSAFGVNSQELVWSDSYVETTVIQAVIDYCSTATSSKKSLLPADFGLMFDGYINDSMSIAESAADSLARHRFSETISTILTKFEKQELRVLREVDDHIRFLVHAISVGVEEVTGKFTRMDGNS